MEIFRQQPKWLEAYLIKPENLEALVKALPESIELILGYPFSKPDEILNAVLQTPAVENPESFIRTVVYKHGLNLHSLTPSPLIVTLKSSRDGRNRLNIARFMLQPEFKPEAYYSGCYPLNSRAYPVEQPVISVAKEQQKTCDNVIKAFTETPFYYPRSELEAFPNLQLILQKYADRLDGYNLTDVGKERILDNPPVWFPIHVLQLQAQHVGRIYRRRPADFMQYFADNPSLGKQVQEKAVSALLFMSLEANKTAVILSKYLQKMDSEQKTTAYITELAVDAIRAENLAVTRMLLTTPKVTGQIYSFESCGIRAPMHPLCRKISRAAASSTVDEIHRMVCDLKIGCNDGKFIKISGLEALADPALPDAAVLNRLQQLIRDQSGGLTEYWREGGLYPHWIKEAVRQERLPVLKWLVDKNIKSEKYGAAGFDTSRKTLLSVLVENNDMQTVQKVLNRYENKSFIKQHVNAVVRGKSILELARHTENTAMVKLLKGNGAIDIPAERSKWADKACAATEKVFNAQQSSSQYTAKETLQMVKQAKAIFDAAHRSYPPGRGQRESLFPGFNSISIASADFPDDRQRSFEEDMKKVQVRGGSYLRPNVERFYRCKNLLSNVYAPKIGVMGR